MGLLEAFPFKMLCDGAEEKVHVGASDVISISRRVKVKTMR